jgi:S-DNA-T family DNA segregation ATPase FtsK/SpoIIIE
LFTQSSVLVPLRILKKIGDWGVSIIQVVGTYIFTGSRINTGEEETVRYQKQQRYKKGEEETEKDREDVISVRIPEVVLPEDTSIPQDKTMSYTTSQPQQLPCEYQLPDITLLNDPPVTSEKDLREDLLMTSKLLSETLEDFGIDAKVVQVNRGPVVTSFEVQPAPGVKVSKIVSLSDDIALALAAPSIRIEAPIPGKKVIGIEIPNRKATTVGLKEVLLSQEFKNSTSKLTLGLGKDIMGNPVITDLAKMPHMLVAGATGSGKSVCINGAIMSILYKAHPDEVKFLMIDPKMVELSIYNGIPHLRFPVITGPKEAVKSLRWLVKEMEDRYKLLASEGVRHIDNYNNRMKTRNEKIMPYIVAVIDELADLMMVASQECEDAIARLAQMARAVGIHLILATQRPSVDVITGVIKANFPSRIAFQVFSKTDSRTILDMNGAEKLLGRGDMLFLPPSAPKPIRLQGSFLTNEEIERVLNFIKAQGFEPPDEKFSPCILEDDQTTPFEQDELFENALRLAVRMEGISTSMIQRKLKIGYNRAARLVELMEEHNFIGPADGVKPREVYITHEDLERLFGKK